jgi:hypothetical protein
LNNFESEGRIMKTVIFSVFIMLALSWGCGTALAEGEGKGKEGGGSGQSVSGEIEKKEKGNQADAGDPNRQERPIRIRQRGRFQDRGEVRKEQRDKIREARHETPQEGTAKGKGHQQQLKAVEGQMNHEEAKHRSRIARLNRIRQLAEQDGKTETVERVDKLLEKEQRGYEHRLQLMTEKKQKVLQLSEKAAGKETHKGIKESQDKEKPEGESKDKPKGTGQ